MTLLYCATTNPGKLREFQLGAARWARGVRVEPVPGLTVIPAPGETGATFRDNAVIKAVAYSRFAPGLVFADDSGLAVDALDGEPGVHSARYAGEGASDRENTALVLEKMRGRTGRSARFLCVIALARGGGLIETFEGAVEGILLEQERGKGGFGYDPLFFYPPLNCTLAELDASRKLGVSHRGQALERMFASVTASAGLSGAAPR